MVISSSEITDNIASQAGGIQNRGTMGIQIDINNGDSILPGTTLLSGNQAVSTEENPAALDGGAIYNDGALKIANSTIEHNTARGGGGILNWFDDNTSLGTVEITSSTIANNWAGNGGGIENGCSDGQIGCGTLILRNSTLFNNRAIDIGGGIVNFGTGRTIIANSTLAFNTASTGGGIHNSEQCPDRDQPEHHQ